MIELIINLGAVLTGIIAIFISVGDRKLSNKQVLFDKRARVYSEATAFVNLFKQNEKNVKEMVEKKKFLRAIDLFFSYLTNNRYLENTNKCLSEPLGSEAHKDFLVKLEDIKSLSLEIELIFKEEDAKLLSDFILAYGETLFAVFQYHILFEKMRSYSVKYIKDIEEVYEIFDESTYRNNLLEDLNKLIDKYNILMNDDRLETIKKSIKL